MKLRRGAGAEIGERTAVKRAASLPPGLLVVPLVAMIVTVFVCPLIWFFLRVFADLGSLGDLMALTASVIGSEVVLRAIMLTLWIALAVTLICVVVAYPVSFVLSQTRGIGFTLIIITIVIPYFTSVIVRTYS